MIVWNICLPFSRFAVSVISAERKLKILIVPIEEAHKASQANLKRQFAMLADEFRGHANAMVEEMTAYMRVSPCLS